MNPNEQAQIDVSKLPPEALTKLHKELEVELNALQRAIPIIQTSINACTDAMDAIDGLKKQKQGEEMLIPVSESAYAYGKVVDVEQVLVMMGGNFCAEMNSADAIKFYENRVNNRKVELGKMRQAIANHQLTKEQIEMELRSRMPQQQQQAQAD